MLLSSLNSQRSPRKNKVPGPVGSTLPTGTQAKSHKVPCSAPGRDKAVAVALPDAGRTEEAAVFQTSCSFQNKAPSHFPISGTPKRNRTVFIKSSEKQTVL